MCIVGVGQSNIAGPQYTTSEEFKPSIIANLTSHEFILPEVTGSSLNLPFEVSQWKLSIYKMADPSSILPSERDMIFPVNTSDRLFLN